MTKFDAKLIQMNARTNAKMDKVLAEMGRPQTLRPITEKRMVDKVLRPFIHVVNEAELNNRDPVELMDAMVATMAAMATEYMVRSTPRDMPEHIMGNMQGIVDDFLSAFIRSVEVNFNISITPAHAAAPPTSGAVQ